MVPRTQKLRSSLVGGTQGYQRFPLSTPGVGQNIATAATAATAITTATATQYYYYYYYYSFFLMQDYATNVSVFCSLF